MKSLTIFLSITALLFFSTYCSEPTEPQKEKDVFTVVVTGKVNELMPSGTQPLADCNVSLIATNSTVVSQTDSNGVFLDTLITSDDTFRLKLEKAGFSTIDSVLHRNNVDSLSFIMNAANGSVTGVVWEYRPLGGNHTSDSCKISIITSEGTTVIYSDQNGDFSGDVTTKDPSIRLLFEKELFETIDTTIQRSSAQYLWIQIIFNKIEVSGRLFKINEDGIFPSPYCDLKIYSGGVENIVTTNDEGFFRLVTSTYNETVRIVVNKVQYINLDTTMYFGLTTNLELFLYKTVNYFPLNVGNKWKYYGEYYPGGDFIWYDYEGEEWWELTDLAYDSSWFKIVTDFTGLKIEKVGGTPRDTIYLYNEIAELTLNTNDGILSLNSATGSDISLLKWFFETLNWTGITKPRITYPVNSPDTISIFIEHDFDFLKYDLIKNIGFDTLAVQYFPMPPFVSYASLGLLEYNIQK